VEERGLKKKPVLKMGSSSGSIKLVDKFGAVGLAFEVNSLSGLKRGVTVSRVETSNGKLASEQHMVMTSMAELEEYLESDPYRYELTRLFAEVSKRVEVLLERKV
jgi:hypothetical protein